ncbi:methyl-accepting chemotaxis protein [Pseudomonas fluorescens]|uniref:Methyl-accepting chemotaxis protein n=1 Tax=Pseudomonas fluorescens TaxID=294 RepID=A0A423LFU8_PSEFL|nr:hypothetical protein BK671_14415 [Pseudomonas fluorescens]
MQWFMDVKLKIKLILAFLMVAMVSLVIGIAAYVNINKVNGVLTSTFADRLVPIRDLGYANNELKAHLSRLYRVCTETDLELSAAMAPANEESERKVIGLIAQYRKTKLVSAEEQGLIVFDKEWPAYIQSAQRAMALGVANKNEESLAVLRSEVEPHFLKLQTVLDDLIKVNDDAAQQMSAEANTLVTGISRTMIGLMIGGFALAITIGLLITRMIVRPLQVTLGAAERIAAGDFSVDIMVDRQDELGQLLQSMQTSTLGLRGLISHIRDGVVQLASSAEELSAVTEQTNSGVNSQRMETDQVATAMNEMAATVHEVARNAEDASAAASAADQQAREGEVAAQEAIVQMGRLADEVVLSSDAVDHLMKESEKIGGVLDVIKSVAGQINLLALNAAIEAARAGEQGRGFAVVADEVRALAQRTQKSTEEIETLIAGVQSGTERAVTLMDSSRNLTESTLKLMRDTGSRLVKIAEAVSTIQAMNQQIASAAEQQGAVAEEINRSVISVRDISEQTAAASEETAASSGKLALLGNDLQTMVSQFRT